MSKFKTGFTKLFDDFFSLDNSVEYYKKTSNTIPLPLRNKCLYGVRDLAAKL